MNNTTDKLKSVAEGIELLNRLMNSFTKEYTNTHHIMRKDFEVLIPSNSNTEKYTFWKTENWKVIQNDNNVIVIEKL